MKEPGHELAIVVVDGFLDHRLTDALRQAAVNLPFDNQRIDQVPGIVHGHELQQRRLAGLAVHLEHRDVAAERIGIVGRLEERLFAEARLETGRQGTGTYAKADTSANDLPEAGAPFTKTRPFSKTRSSSAASSIAAANFAIFVFTLPPARCSAVPPTACDRLPKVPTPCFTMAVSP